MTKKITPVAPMEHIIQDMLPAVMTPTTPRAGIFAKWAEVRELRHMQEVSAIKTHIASNMLETVQAANQTVIEYLSAPKKLAAELKRFEYEANKQDAEIQKANLENAILGIEYESAVLDLKLKKKEVNAIVNE